MNRYEKAFQKERKETHAHPSLLQLSQSKY